MATRHEFPIDKLRAMEQMFNAMNESFNQSFRSLRELELIYDAHQKSDYDYYPDQWTDKMVKAALQGKSVDAVMPKNMK